jgi:hypothetical protein
MALGGFIDTGAGIGGHFIANSPRAGRGSGLATIAPRLRWVNDPLGRRGEAPAILNIGAKPPSSKTSVHRVGRLG